MKWNVSLLVTRCLLASSADNLLQTVWTQIRTDKMFDLVWIQTVWHSDMELIKKFFERVYFGEKSSNKNNSNSITMHAKSVAEVCL